MIYTGREIVTDALTRIGMIDPVDAPDAELEQRALRVAKDVLDNWRIKKLTIAGVTRNVHPLTINTQAHTIGDGGNLNQTWPTAIERWSVIPDDTATDPFEISKGRPLTFIQWQAISVKSQSGSHPTKMYFDGKYAAGLGTCYFWPIPDNANVSAVLYTHVPDITTLALATPYDLEPGVALALKLNLAVEFADAFGRTPSPRLEMRAKETLGDLKSHHIIPREAPIRPDFVIGRHRRTVNVYNTDQ